MTADREAALRAGVRAEVFTVGWMVIEAAVAIAAGIVAKSVLLTAFGADSVSELLSGGVLLWRLRAEAGDESAKTVEATRGGSLGDPAGRLMPLHRGIERRRIDTAHRTGSVTCGNRSCSGSGDRHASSGTLADLWRFC